MRNTVFIHTNPKQAVGALVARHALLRNSAAPERFDVRIIDTSDFPAFARYEAAATGARGSTGSGTTTTCSRSRRRVSPCPS